MSTNPPVPIKALTGTEILSDIPDLFNIALKAKADFADQPLPTTAKGWVTRFGFADGGLVASIAAAYDQLHGGTVTLDEIAKLLGLTPNSVLGLAESLVVKVVAQAND